MKKTLFFIVCVAILVFAFAGAAFAIDRSGQDRAGANTMGDAGFVSTVPDAVLTDVPNHSGTAAPIYDQATNSITAPVAGAGTFTYKNWDPINIAGNVGQGNSPHGNYTTTTVKCVVCHAVHYAAPGNATVASGNQDADTLLRMKASDACIYCHATAGVAVNGRPVYNGLGGLITGNGATGGNTTTGHAVGTNCGVCHASVHGMGSDESVASLQGFLLREIAVDDFQATGADTGNMLDAVDAINPRAVSEGFADGAALNGTFTDYRDTNSATLREQAVGVFCAECHSGAYATAAAGASTSVMGAKLSGHRIATGFAGGDPNWNADGSISSGLVRDTQIAWAAATNCKSCHDAKDNYNNDAFPHAWGRYITGAPADSGTKMWLMQAASAADTKGTITAGTSGDGGQLIDGVCLKCHVSGTGDGVGLSF